jgi:thiol-disulfide isomerase/thioredoxin
MSLSKRLGIAVWGLMILLIIGLVLDWGGDSGSTKVGAEVGLTAPDFTLEDLGGNAIKLSDLRGQAVMLNFWASWCSPCKEEMPDLEAVFQQYKGKVRILTVNLTNTERSIDEVEKFLADNGYKMPVALDKRGEVATTYLVRGIPTSFFIDSKGIIRLIVPGSMTKEMMEDGLRQAGANI